MSACRDCDEPCFWARTEHGKSMLVNANTVLGGNLELDLSSETHLVVHVKRDPNVHRYVSHFATCPAAERRRRR